MAGIIEARFRESKSFCEQIGHRSFVIIPHEICVKKATANMMITYYEFHYCKQLAKLQFPIASHTKSGRRGVRFEFNIMLLLDIATLLHGRNEVRNRAYQYRQRNHHGVGNGCTIVLRIIVTAFAEGLRI